MRTALISHNPANRRLILIFSGWSTIPAFYSDISAPGWDIKVVYDYSSPEFDVECISGYSTVYVVAWSLGVAAAEIAARHFGSSDIAAAFAINGTLSPADDEMGIPKAIYEGTRRTLSIDNLRRFRRRMAPAPISEADFISDSDADAEDAILRLQRELDSLHFSIPQPCLPWKRVYIGLNDRIFPAGNQLKAWSSLEIHPQIITLQEGHWMPLQKIISEITPDHSRIARRFSRAVTTYDGNAPAQQHIARRLAAKLPGTFRGADGIDLLEIGPGSGRLTRELAEILHPASATFIDLYPLHSFGIADRETYITGDAEDWIETAPSDRFDIVASASTIQWFADPLRFFRNVRRVLRPGGVFLCSTFLPGNLAELDVLRPSPLLYRSREEIESMLQPLFHSLQLEEEIIPMDFPSPREALLHLKLTGVGGGSKATVRNLLTSLPDRPRLTYVCLYIRAYK